MAKEKKPVHKVQMTEGKREIIRKLAAYVILGISTSGIRQKSICN